MSSVYQLRREYFKIRNFRIKTPKQRSVTRAFSSAVGHRFKYWSPTFLRLLICFFLILKIAFLLLQQGHPADVVATPNSFYTTCGRDVPSEKYVMTLRDPKFVHVEKLYFICMLIIVIALETAILVDLLHTYINHHHHV
jgi:uncharacterized membrane protein